MLGRGDLGLTKFVVTITDSRPIIQDKGLSRHLFGFETGLKLASIMSEAKRVPIIFPALVMQDNLFQHVYNS